MPKITKNLIIINILFWLGSIVATRHGVDLTGWLGLHFFMASDFEWYQLFTYLFMHGSFEHLFFNMLAVWMFGRVLEYAWGERRFLTYYIVCGVGAGLVQELVQYVQYVTTLQGYSGVNLGSYVVSLSEYLNMMTTVGASGAVYGILLAFGMLYPNERIYIYFVLPLKAKWFVVVYAVIELLMGLSQRGDGVAHFAHLGGMLFGLLLLMYWRNKRGGYGHRETLMERILRLKEQIKGRFKPQPKNRTYHFQENRSTPNGGGGSADEIDKILQKIKQSGYESLTTAEKQRLFDASKK